MSQQQAKIQQLNIGQRVICLAFGGEVCTIEPNGNIYWQGEVWDAQQERCITFDLYSGKAKDSDYQVMKRARMPFINEVEFRGVTYRNLLIVNNAQIFHGVFDSIKTAHDKMAELTTKKRGNFFEVIEV